MPEFTLDKPDDERLAGVLRERTVSIASRMGIEPPASRLLLNPFLGSYGAIIDKKGLGVAANAVDVMSHDELSFLVAHELAHLKLGHLVVRKGWLIASVGLPLVGFALAVTAAFLTNTSRLVLPCAFAIIMLSRLVLHPLRVRVIRQQEFQADALAIQITGDPSTAARTLKLITLTSSNPTVSARIAAIKKDYPGAIYDA